MGYEVPLFLGGKDAISNYEETDTQITQAQASLEEQLIMDESGNRKKLLAAG